MFQENFRNVKFRGICDSDVRNEDDASQNPVFISVAASSLGIIILAFYGILRGKCKK